LVVELKCVTSVFVGNLIYNNVPFFDGVFRLAKLILNWESKMNEPEMLVEPINLFEPKHVKSFNPMRQMLTLATLSTCLLLGILGALLFDGAFSSNSKFWGLNVAIFALLLVVSLLLLRKLGQRPLSITGYALVVSGLFFTITMAWRDSLMLNGLSLLGMLLTINLAFTLGTRRKLQPRYVSEALFDLSWSTKYGISSYYKLMSQDVQWKEVQRRWGTEGRAVLRGFVITIPLLILFGLLLIASDARFERMVYDLLDWGLEPKKVIQYVVIFILCGWAAAAILRGGVLKQGLTLNQDYQKKSPTWTLGTIEIVMLLSTLNILFLGFIAVQFSYFFGGDALVQSLGGPTYADYARRGFFQLVTVALLVITLLLLIHWLHKPSRRLGKKLYQLLAIIMVVATMIIEISATHRMYLYTSVYGLTELRFYTSVFMVWLVVLFVWFSVTVLRGQQARFTFGAVLSCMVFIGLLHVVNPDAKIAEVNLARLQAGQRFDLSYVTSLSADAIPTLYAALDNIPKSKSRCQDLWRNLKSHRVLWVEKDWRNFNLARYEAWKLLSSPSEPKCQ